MYNTTSQPSKIKTKNSVKINDDRGRTIKSNVPQKIQNYNVKFKFM